MLFYFNFVEVGGILVLDFVSGEYFVVLKGGEFLFLYGFVVL